MVARADHRVRALTALARAKAATTPPDQDDRHRAVLALLTAWFGSKAAIAATELPDDLLDRLVASGLDRQAAATVGEMVLARPLSGRSRHGAPDPYAGMPATRRVASGEPQRRAQYLLAAAARLTQALAIDRHPAALEAEQRYLEQHVEAGRARRRNARRVDELGKDGQVLVWRAVMDDRTAPECAALNGRLFTADNPPALPPLHGRCRCTVESHGRGPLLGWGTKAAASGLTKAGDLDDRVIMMIRHAEKPGEGVHGVDPDGAKDADSLSVTGWVRAGALAEMLANPGSASGLRAPDKIYACDHTSDHSKRSIQTVTPLAGRLGIKIKKREVGDEKKLADKISQRLGVTLVVWRHEDMQPIIDHLGEVHPTPPAAWPDGRFDMIWVFTAAGDGSWRFTQVPQLLLPDDAPDPIGS